MNIQPRMYLVVTVSIFVVIAVCVYYFLRLPPIVELTIGDSVFKAWVADTAHAREIGLSGKRRIAENQAMVFLFSAPDRHGIWMRNMYVPIDIIWLDADKRVIHIERNVSPNTFPNVFRPPTDSLYVIEVTSGMTSKGGIVVGSIASW